jgi:hypothetical protein
MAFVVALLAGGNAASQPASSGSSDARSHVTFNRDIAPIIYQNCASCHRPGESGPFPLLTYSEVKKHATQIVAVTHTHFMPPWLPEPGQGSYSRNAACRMRRLLSFRSGSRRVQSREILATFRRSLISSKAGNLELQT